MTDEGHVGATSISVERLSPAVQRVTDPTAPSPMRLMAAKGLAPMPPRDLVTAQYVLTFDPDEKIRETAKKALGSIDDRIANAVLTDKSIEPPVLEFLAVALAQSDVHAEKLLLNPSTPTRAFIEVALVASEATCELIANNQARILDCPDIARSLTKNPKALRSTVDRVVDFLVRSNIILDDVREFEEAFLRLTGEERVKAADSIELPPDLLDESFLTPEQRALIGDRKLIDEDEEADEENAQSLNLEQRIRGMSIGKKIALATKGNKQARSILLRDTNRLVALAAGTSPLITESEIVTIAQSRTTHGDVITHICRDRKNNWIRNYQVKVGLVGNPKTPIAEALKLVTHLQKKDLNTIAKSRNVPIGVRNRAARLLKGDDD